MQAKLGTKICGTWGNVATWLKCQDAVPMTKRRETDQRRIYHGIVVINAH